MSKEIRHICYGHEFRFNIGNNVVSDNYGSQCYQLLYWQAKDITKYLLVCFPSFLAASAVHSVLPSNFTDEFRALAAIQLAALHYCD